MKGNPFVGMNYSDVGGAAIPGEEHRRRGKVVAVHRKHHWFLVQFAKGYCEGFKYTPIEYANPEQPQKKVHSMIGQGKVKYE